MYPLELEAKMEPKLVVEGVDEGGVLHMNIGASNLRQMGLCVEEQAKTHVLKTRFKTKTQNAKTPFFGTE